MPHYKDWSSSYVEYPTSGETWLSFNDTTDVSAVANSVEWTPYEPSNAPGALTQALYANFWDDINFTRPEAFAVLADNSYTTLAETDFWVWDVSWAGNVGDVSGANAMMSLDQLTNVQTTPYSQLSSIYFQVDGFPQVPEPSTGLLLGIALGCSLLFRWVRRALGLTAGLLLVFVLV